MSEREEYNKAVQDVLNFMVQSDEEPEAKFRMAKMAMESMASDLDAVWKRMEILQDSIADLQEIVNRRAD